MRYRIESYDVVVNGSAVVLTIPVPDAPWQKITAWEEDDRSDETDRYVTESIRLIIDETANVVLCSSMKKANVDAAVVSTEVKQSVVVAISIPTGATIEDTDYFTIEFDWGDAPGQEVKTFDADMALQLSEIIGEESESDSSDDEPISGNSQTELQISQLRTLRESYDALSRSEMDMSIINTMTAEVNSGKQAIIDLLARFAVSADLSMSIEQLTSKVNSIVSFVPFGTEVESITFRNNTDTTEINLSGIRVDYSSSWIQKFYNFPYVKSVVVGGSLYLPNATNIANLVSNASALETLDLRGLTFSNNLQICYQLASGCRSLKTIYFGSGFRGNHITNFNGLLESCYSLTTIDIENITTDYATSFFAMFTRCSSLTTLNLSHFNTANVTTMVSMFSRCSSLVSIDIKGWSASALTDSTQMFNEDLSLETLIGNTTYNDVVTNNIKIFDQYNVTTNTYISNAVNLNRASLRAWINGLKDLTGQTAKTLTLGATLLAKLSADDIAVATNKNWNLT